MTRGAGTEKGWHKIFPGQLWANGSDYGVHPYCNICDISKCVRTCVLCLLIIWNSFTSKCKKYKITEHQILQSDTLANQFRFSFRASCPPPSSAAAAVIYLDIMRSNLLHAAGTKSPESCLHQMFFSSQYIQLYNKTSQELIVNAIQCHS